MMGASTSNSSSNIFSRQIQSRALKEMIKRAVDLGLNKGVAFILIWEDGDDYPQISFSVLELESDPDPTNGKDDLGVNYFGVVMAKLAVMLSVNLDSGYPGRPLKVGEVSYRGGIMFELQGLSVFIGCSGGTETQDVQVSRRGMSSLLSS